MTKAVEHNSIIRRVPEFCWDRIKTETKVFR